jgi:hypothetical protein
VSILEYRSSLDFPEARISLDEPIVIDFEKRCVGEAWSLIPISGLRSPFVALEENVERTCRYVEPGGWCVRGLTTFQSPSAELQEICRRSEAKIEIHAVAKTRHLLAVEPPGSGRRSLDGKLVGPIPNPTTNVTAPRAPRNIARRSVCQTSWTSAKTEHGCSP